jgi:predicted ATPase/class 3 adenylate cyclase
LKATVPDTTKRQSPAVPTARALTFLFTDVAGSTQGWEQHPDAYGAALQRHFDLLEACVREAGGDVFKTVGDQVCAVFSHSDDAVRAAVASQRRLAAEPWPAPVGPVHVRMALHAGAPNCRDGDYFGPPVNRVARLLQAAHPDQILLSVAVHDGLSAGGAEISTRPLGVHRLKDLQNPEAIFQAVAPGLPDDFPPPRTLDARAHNLPVQLTSFVGRAGEMEALAERLADPATRLVTLLGPPGVGKTRLATQFAAEYAYRYPDGVWLVELAGVRDPNAVARQIETAMGLSQDDGRPPADRLFDALAERHLLLVCDNFEHVLPAADVLSGLLRSTRNVQVLVTSRSLLRMRGETVMEIAPLPAPEASAVLNVSDLAECAATALFIDRANTARPAWLPTDAEAADVADLCRRLDGLPLAIELAAARLRSMTLGDVRARLSDRLRLLAGGAVDVPERQRTLRAALDWSFELLAPDEQAMLAQLAVFRGGFTLESAEEVCDAADVWDAVPSLHDQSFLLVRERGGVMRYDMLEVVRQYAGERLGEGTATRRAAHAAYFLPLTESASASMDTRDDAAASDLLDAEIDNIRAAISWACETGHTEICARLTAAIAEFLHRRGWWAERLQRLEAATATARAGFGAAPVTAWLCYHLSNALADLGRLPEAADAANDALRRARALPDARLEAWSLNLLGFLAERGGERRQAEAYYAETAEVAGRTGDAFSLASALTNRGRLADLSGDAARAIRYHEDSLPLWRAVGSARGLATTLTNIGCIEDEVKGREADEQGRTDDARACRHRAIELFGEALGLQLQLRNLPKVALLLNNIGEALARDGRAEDAVPLYVAAERIFRQAGSASADYVAAQKTRALESLPRARAAALARRAELQDPLEIARTLRPIAFARMDANRLG